MIYVEIEINHWNMLKHIAQTTRIGNLLEMKYFGSELAKDTMKYLSINNNNNMHALFLLSGEAGVGKTTFTQGFINECISANNQSENQSIQMEENQKHHHIPPELPTQPVRETQLLLKTK